MTVQGQSALHHSFSLYASAALVQLHCRLPLYTDCLLKTISLHVLSGIAYLTRAVMLIEWTGGYHILVSFS